MLDFMVTIECPHCDEELEMEDDAVGLFDCPYCSEEFEWEEKKTMKTSLKELMKLAPLRIEVKNTPKSILVEYPENPSLRITAGVIFSIIMGINAISSLMLIFAGLMVSQVEEGISDATAGAAESSIGAIIILIGVVMLALYSTGVYFGVQMSKGKFSALIVCSVITVVSLIMTIISWVNENTDECLKTEMGPFGPECVEYGSPAFPVFSVIIWAVIIAMFASLIYVPKFRSQFH